MKIKRGMLFKSKKTHVVIEILNRQSSTYWNTKKSTGLGQTHRTAECTLKHFYEVVSE